MKKKIRHFTRLGTKKKPKAFTVMGNYLRVRGPGIGTNANGQFRDTVIHIHFDSLDAEDIRQLLKLAPAVFKWRRRKQAATK